ncbi:ubiquitin-protein ligase E3B [Strongylocentrotus purpuratus]|uniref:Ubiquitin-protein ligase E3B n=1 Tax=Strongylocentrotus purpuratus TaxID=7668 RepID=A0A7M7P9W5_STRPU|nr:ubiquitin-protein ligase E3B [Strongylocentrotus purpuratus]
MFSQKDTSKKSELLDKAKSSRTERALLRKKEQSVVRIQSLVRSFICRRRYRRAMLQNVDKILQANPGIPDNPDAITHFFPAAEVYIAIKRFLYIYDEKKDLKRFEKICRYLTASMESSKDAKVWYVSLALTKEYVLPWIQQLKQILWLCASQLKKLKPDLPIAAKSIALHLHMLITFTDTATWKIFQIPKADALRASMGQICSNVMGHLVTKGLYPVIHTLLKEGLTKRQPALSPTVLNATMVVAWRPLVAGSFSSNLLCIFISHILPVPGLVSHLSTAKAETLTAMKNNALLPHCLKYLSTEGGCRTILSMVDATYSLCLLANMVHLAHLDNESLKSNLQLFMNVTTTLLNHCQAFVGKKKSNTTSWHPVLGWFSQPFDNRLQEAMGFVQQQLQHLWGQTILPTCVLGVLKGLQPEEVSNHTEGKTPTRGGNLLKKLQRMTSKLGNHKSCKSLNSQEVILVCSLCSMYQTALSTLTELRRDILTGLSYRDLLLPRLWKFIAELGPHGGLRVFQDCLANSPSDQQSILSVLMLFCDSASYLIAILDDGEFYDQQIPFHPDDLLAVSSFLNLFVFKVIWEHNLDENPKLQSLFNSTHTLLMLLFDKDCRRQFATPAHWLVKDLKMSTFKSELEKSSKRADLILQKIPHIIPHRERVILFRKRVSDEKKSLGYTESPMSQPHSTYITVHRSRLVEDGYQQLASVASQALKGCIRVNFINEQGLDEAGIDQDGVFKEFLEEIIKTVFNPSLNLFKTTEEQRLYPSPTSYINENHLPLFEFVGKMLGKAVYEGIVVEVPFAHFFLSQILDHTHSTLYSPIDELPSLDKELYKNLTFVKHYDGDVADLDLGFSLDEDFMGKLITHELIPGGKAITVNNQNKIKYIHLMAHFRMCQQIRDQTRAFKRGFLSLVNPLWLAWFSGPELQRLISGDVNALDLNDLRKHTQYYGGFHNSHRVINWLFDILSNDFTFEERGLFLKFVTSCSKPPLLGFAHLEPPFSIRCVEVSDDQDTGDTVGSVLRGFLRIQRRDPVSRLPTSSTCFNLLKLPNYQKKSTLKEKLRYAITSNTGFELS